MGARTKARKRALDVLFEAEQRGVPVADLLAKRVVEPGTEASLPQYSVDLVEGVLAHAERIDELLATHAHGWTVARMPAVDRALLRLTTLELDNYVTVADITEIFYLFEVLMTVASQLDRIILELGRDGRSVQMQREEFIGDMNEEYTLMIRDYAADSSEENAQRIRKAFNDTANLQLRSPKRVAEILGYEGYGEDTVVLPLGLRTLSNVSVVRKGMAEQIVDEYGSLSQLMDDIEQNPDRLDDLGVDNPTILADSLYRMWGKRA